MNIMTTSFRECSEGGGVHKRKPQVFVTLENAQNYVLNALIEKVRPIRKRKQSFVKAHRPTCEEHITVNDVKNCRAVYIYYRQRRKKHGPLPKTRQQTTGLLINNACLDLYSSTTNGCDAYLNADFYSAQPDTYLFVETLLRQQTSTYISLESLSQSRPVRKISREKSAFLRPM